MKRAGIFLTLISVIVLVFAGIALAAVINGNNGNNNLVGTPRGDHIRGFGGNDTIRGRGGEDDMFGGRGRDFIRAVDRREDDITCGRGFDRVRANPGDDIEGGCERVVRDGIRVDDNDRGDDDGGGDD
jgi:Ca2+-binding RTX toxin-like protein